MDLNTESITMGNKWKSILPVLNSKLIDVQRSLDETQFRIIYASEEAEQRGEFDVIEINITGLTNESSLKQDEYFGGEK